MLELRPARPRGRRAGTVSDVTRMSAQAEFRIDDVVRLLDRHGDVPSGAVGRIVGKFRHAADLTYLVSFAVEACVVDVGFDELVLAHDVRASV